MRINKINPITRMDYPDPDIIRVDNEYIMISTTMHFFPGGAILRSYNLKDWEIISYLFDELDDTPGERLERELVDYGGGMFAPCIRYHQGKFYVIFNSNTDDRKTYIFEADSVYGPWKRTVLDEVFYDCSLFFDDDGAVYVVYGNRTIRITELKQDLSGVKENGLNRILFEDTCEGLGFEGSHIYKASGYYYVFNINWPKGDIRTQWCHRSKSLTGEFEEKRIFHTGFDFADKGVAQGGIVDTPEGYFAFLFEDMGSVGRIPVIMPMSMEDGWPVLGEAGQVPNDFALPGIDKSVEKLYTSDEFRYEKDENGNINISPQWQWNHQLDKRYVDFCPGGGLKITTNKISINVTHAQNTLTQRMLYPWCAASVEIDASGLMDGDVAGLCGLQSQFGFIGIWKNAGSFFLVKVVRSEKELHHSRRTGDCLPGEILEQIRLDDSKVRVMLSADFEKLKDSLDFYYYLNDECIKLGDSHQMSFSLDHFTGYRFGLFVYSTRNIGGFAIFKNFEYMDKKGKDA